MAAPGELPATAIAALWKGNKIEAIRIVRQEWGVDLKAAHDAVNAYVGTQPALGATLKDSGAANWRGCMGWAIALAAVAAVVAYYLLRGR